MSRRVDRRGPAGTGGRKGRENTRSPAAANCGASTRRPIRPRGATRDCFATGESIWLRFCRRAGNFACVEPPIGSMRRRPAEASTSADVPGVRAGADHGRARPAADRLRRNREPRVAGPGSVAAEGGRVRPGPPLAELRLVAVNAAGRRIEVRRGQSLTEDGRIGKVLDVQGSVGRSAAAARQRWTPICGPLLLSPAIGCGPKLRGANAVRRRALVAGGADARPRRTGRADLADARARSLGRGAGKGRVDGATSEFTLLGQGDAAETLAAGAEAMFRRRDDGRSAHADRRQAAVARRVRGHQQQRVARLAHRDGRRPQRAADGRLSQGDGRHSRPDRPHDHRGVVRQPHRRAGWKACSTFRCRPMRRSAASACGSATSWSRPTSSRSSGPARSTKRSSASGATRACWSGPAATCSRPACFPIEPHSREADQDRLHAGAAAARQPLCATATACGASCCARSRCGSWRSTCACRASCRCGASSCPTHAVRAEQTEHAAHVEFAAQEYTPTRDFEVVCEIDGRQSDVVVIPHQRGEDGYFLVQLTPPCPGGQLAPRDAARRRAARAGARCATRPARWTARADGSSASSSRRCSSLARAGRSLQPRRVRRRLHLGVRRRRRRGRLQRPASTSTKRLQFLDARRSLGWTDLDKTFAAVLGRATDKTQVIYIGDGVPSSGDADPQALVGPAAAAVRRQPARHVPRRRRRQPVRGDRAQGDRRPGRRLAAADRRRADAAARGAGAAPRNHRARPARHRTSSSRRAGGGRVSRATAEPAGRRAADSRRPVSAAGRRSKSGELIVTGTPRRRDGAVCDARSDFPPHPIPAPSPSRGGLGRGSNASTSRQWPTGRTGAA